MSVFASVSGNAYEKVNGPTGLNQLIARPVEDLILFESKASL